jgi:starch phosphorylase
MDMIFKDKEDFLEQYKDYFRSHLSREFNEVDNETRYEMLARLIAHRARRVENRMQAEVSNKKRVYYFSLEFLIGPLLDNYLLNFGVRDMVAEGLKELGMDLDELCALDV